MASPQIPDPAQLLADRKQARAARAQIRRQKAESHKAEVRARLLQLLALLLYLPCRISRETKNSKKGNYEEAMECYHDAIAVNGPQPHILSNIAATYLKMGDYQSAENAACHALLHDPLFIKARYRRALARKGLKHFKKAMSDLVWILQQDPSLTEAKTELNALRSLCKADRIRLDDEVNDVSQDMVKVEIDYASDSSGCRHEGNGTPCRSYNHAGCTKGRDCPYSHAVDHNSVRDDLCVYFSVLRTFGLAISPTRHRGKNVCLYYVVDMCKFREDECAYSHCRDYLPAGRWWDDEEKVDRVSSMILSDHPAREDTAILQHYLGTLDNRLVWRERNFASVPEQLEQWLPHFKALGEWMEEALGDNTWSDSEDSWSGDYGSEDSGSLYRGGGHGRAAMGNTGRRGPHGFTDDEVEELCAQGVSPWDSDARVEFSVPRLTFLH
ncbi:hypothetical protein EVG20_g5852 [Dentipellis fragilis]|uniref:C3H1-type domain-containing protein n=1 Tax=Dentipellis fragilis TaxID=205917 RepID=A0A4Y9YQS3_9AGAM|nr:hypothetical protein EVG20_g5852 [Dentipellis fragilis]